MQESDKPGNIEGFKEEDQLKNVKEATQTILSGHGYCPFPD